MSRRDSAPIRIGLIGIGAIASAVHLRVLRWVPGAAVVAGADPSPEARAHARRIAGIESVADAAELLARDDIAAVVICARSDRHAELAIAAAEAGKHFYLEKPIATCAADARRVVDAVARAEIIGAIGFNHRFHPLHQRARKLLLDGAIGAVHAVQTAFCEPASVESMPDWKRWRATGGGALLDLGSHQIDLLRWFLDDEIERVEASIMTRRTQDDTAWIELCTARGTVASGFFSFCAGRGDFFRFIGEQGMLLLDRYALSLELALTRSDVGAVRRRRLPPPGAVTPWRVRKFLRPAHEPSYRRSLRAFVEALRGRSRELPSMIDGLRSLEVVLAAEASARAGEMALVAAPHA